MSNTKFYEQAKIAMQKITPAENDVIVVYFPVDIADEQMALSARYLSDIAQELGITIICAKQDTQVQQFSEIQMNQMGWHRFDTMANQ